MNTDIKENDIAIDMRFIHLKPNKWDSWGIHKVKLSLRNVGGGGV
jgi:hypothetical protein